MKREINKEMDLLLRRLGRRHDNSALDADTRNMGEHLDADELSSFAENALPAAARARYTEHLAECSNCRELVVQLSSSASMVIAEQPAQTSEPTGFRHFLASLFSPMVLRYAVPALGLIVIAAIGLFVFNNQQPAADTQVAVQQAPPPSRATPEIAARLYDSQQKAGPSPNDIVRKQEQNDPPPPSAAPSGTLASDAKKEAPLTRAEQPPVVADSVVAQSPKPQPEVNFSVEAERRKEGSETKAGAASKVASEQPSEQTKAENRRAEDEVAAARPAKNAPASAASGASIRARTGIQRDGVDEKDKADAETRIVGGRRFRKERGIWIDMSYDAGARMITLARGSEQYRALVADEPTIKTIADQLDGEIIVVWKGRAYRIR